MSAADVLGPQVMGQPLLQPRLQAAISQLHFAMHPRFDDARFDDARLNDSRFDDPRADEPRAGEAQVDQARVEDPRDDAPRIDAPRFDNNRINDYRVDKPRVDEPQVGKPRADVPRVEESRDDALRIVAPRFDDHRVDDHRVDEPRSDEPQVEESQVDGPRLDEPRDDASRIEDPRFDDHRADEPRADDPRPNEPRVDEPQVDEPQVDEPQVNEPLVTPRPEPQPDSEPEPEQPSPNQDAPDLEPARVPQPTTPAPAPKRTLLSLPPEILVEIYTYLLQVPPYTQLELVRTAGTTPSTAVLLACRQTYAQALPLLYARNRFQAHPALLACQPRLRAWFAPVSASSVLPLIRRWYLRVRLDADAPPCWSASDVRDAFAGADELVLELWRAGAVDLSHGRDVGAVAVLRRFEGVRGVRIAKIFFGCTQGVEGYVRWLEAAMRSPVGREVGEYVEQAPPPAQEGEAVAAVKKWW